MARTDGERKTRLWPPKPRAPRNERAARSSGFKLLMHYARMSRRTGNRTTSGKGKGACPYHQRCAVRVTYLNNKTRGQWQAHGRYLARESATFLDGAPTLDVKDLGDTEQLLTNPRHLAEGAPELLKRGIMPTEDGWGGWLGKYQAALCKTTREIEERKERNLARARRRQRDRSVGR